MFTYDRKRVQRTGAAARGHLQASGLSYRTRGGRTLVANVTLDVKPHERVAIVGPNGAGKTTLLRMLYGALSPSDGAVTLDGVALGRISVHARARNIAVVLQTEQPDLRMVLRDYVALGRIPHHAHYSDATHRAIVADALESTGIAALAERSLAALSGGELQRARVARALAQSPSVLLLDEPTNHLDLRGRADLLALARKRGVTVVAVLHDLALVRPFADTVVVLQAGRLVAYGPPATALTPDIVRSVFDVESFEAVDPSTGRAVTVLHAPDA